MILESCLHCMKGLDQVVHVGHMASMNRSADDKELGLSHCCHLCKRVVCNDYALLCMLLREC